MKRELMILGAVVVLALAQLTAPAAAVRTTIVHAFTMQVQTPDHHNGPDTCCATTDG